MRWFLFLLLPVLPAMTCGPLDAPSPDACENPRDAQIQSLEIGARYENGFLPLANGASVPLIRGFQGADMVGVRLRTVGDSLPQCLKQTTTLRNASGSVIAKVGVPLNTYRESGEPTLRTSHTLWLAFDDTPAIGEVLSLEVTTSAGTEARSFTLVEEVALAIPTVTSMHMERGGTGVIELQLAAPAPEGGRVVIVSDDSGTNLLATSPTVTIPEGRLRHSLRIELSETANGGPIYVMDEGGQTTIDIDVGFLSAPGPQNPLLFNEVYAATEQGSEDFNCDGVIDSNDSFVEIHNPSAFALDLQGVRIHQSSPAGDRAQYSFVDATLGPFETILLMTKVGAPGCATEDGRPAPNMLPLAGQRLSISGASGPTDQVDLPLQSGESSQVRSPEFIGAFALHSSVSESGALASPGRRANGEVFAEE